MSNIVKYVNQQKEQVKRTFMKSALLFVFMLGIIASSYAQQFVAEEQMLDNLEADIDRSGSTSNEVRLLQHGHNNTAVAGQNSENSHSLPNVITSVQHGVGNEVFILQQGNGNFSKAIQAGVGNAYDLYLDGDENSTNLYQYGIDNNVEQYLTGDGIENTVVQLGARNELIQVGNTPETPNYQVLQKGIGISIVIENQSLY